MDNSETATVYVAEPSARQMRAARAFFRWTQPQAAKQFGIFVDTLRDIETERLQPQKTTTRAVGAALAALGASFDPDGNMILPR